jgi:chloride channel protein, CIC family
MKKSLTYLIQWMIISVTAGITGALMVAFFFYTLMKSSTFILSTSIPFPLWTIGGAMVSGLLFYRFSPTASGDGIPSYINGVLKKNGTYSFRETTAKFLATLTALATLSGGGMLGPAGRVSAGLNSQIVKLLTKLNILSDNRRIAAICGMSAAVGAIFHSPVGGGIFAVEVLQRANMRYTDLFPAILSSSIAVYIYNFFPMVNPLKFNVPEGIFSTSIMFPILVTSVAAAYVGRLYTLYFDFISSLFRKGNRQKIILKLFLGALIASSAVFFFSPTMAGNIKGLVEAVIDGRVYPVLSVFSSIPAIILYLLFIVIVATSSTVSIASGISVGLTSPSVLIGLFTGAVSAMILGYNPTDPAYYFLLVAGFAGLLSSTINVPIGAAVIAIESFGASYGFCAGISSIIGFQVNRHHTLYDYTVSYTD